MSWYLNRLKSMTLAEVVWRVVSAAKAILLRMQVVLLKGVEEYAPSGISEGDEWVAEYPFKLIRLPAAPASIRIFDCDFPTDHKFDWFFDPCTRKRAPASFSKTLNVRSPEVVGDIKYIWEINRHQHLSALSCCRDADGRFEYISSQIGDWIDQNPFLFGPNWASNLELGLRLISWCIIFGQFKKEFFSRPPLRDRFLGSMYQHQKAIAKGYSRFSSANNHLIGEAAGMYIASTCFPLWPQSAQWKREAKSILEREIALQFTGEGFNRERATAYQLFTMELLSLCFHVGRTRRDEFSEDFRSRMAAAADALSFLVTGQGDLPWFGDSDDGKGFCCDNSVDQVVQVLSMASPLSDPSVPEARETHGLTVDALLDIRHDTKSQPDEQGHFSDTVFPEIGLVSLGDDKLRYRVLFDAGEHGYLSTSAHAHADALSVLLELDERYAIIDPGTFSYHSHTRWRNYFRGTSAHNTVRVDGVDQSTIGGRFLWSDIAAAKLTRFETSGDAATAEGMHTGYLRLADPVLHRRRITLDKRGGRLHISDSFECGGKHLIEVFFHFSQDCRVNLIEGKNGAHAVCGGSAITVSSAEKCLRSELYNGSENPALGWCSRSFHQKFPISTLCLTGTIESSTELQTTILIQQHDN